MARKFNIGRQDEQLLNEEWHGLYSSLKYLNYDRYKNIENVMQERQTPIPDHALRIWSREGLDLLQTYYPNIGDGVWKNLFDGYFHPASAIKPDQDVDVAPYQLCIDPKYGTIHYWDPTQKSWILANANQYNGSRLDIFNGMNFQYISPLEGIADGHYPVPYVPYGKLFSNAGFTSDYQNKNNCAVNPALNIEDGLLSWVHVNASKLAKVDRRFIEIERGNKSDRGFIGVTSTQSEFYLFKKDHRGGQLMLKGTSFYKEDGTIDEKVDYIDVIGGIQLSERILEDPINKYIYSLLKQYPSNVLTITSKKMLSKIIDHLNTK